MSNAKKAKALVATIIANVTALAALSGAASDEGGSEEVSFPSVKEVAKLKGKKLVELAKSLNIETDDVEEEDLKKTLTLVAKFKADAESLSDKEVIALAKGLGLKPAKKTADTQEQISEFLNAEVSEEEADEDSEESEEESEEESDDDADSEDSEDEDSDDSEEDSDDEDSEDSDSEDSDESDEDADEDSDEESDDDADSEDSEDEDSDDEDSEDSDEESDDEESDDEESDDEDSEDSDSEESDDEDSDEVEITKKDLAAYNAKAKKKLKTTEELKKLLTDDDKVVHPMGEAYFRKEVGYCCGIQLEDTDNEGEGKCAVTGKIFTVNDDGALVEKVAKKSKKK